MNNKTILTIILAIMLAFLCALLFLKKEDVTTPNVENMVKEQQETVLPENNKETDVQIEQTENTIQVENTEKKNVITKPIVKSTPKELITNTESKEPTVDEIVVQEGSVIEEFVDPGIKKNDDGSYEITREFKIKSPKKYSFVDFGFLDKISK